MSAANGDAVQDSARPGPSSGDPPAGSEVAARERSSPPLGASRPRSRSGLQLRVERERAVVRFPAEPLAPGVTVVELALEVPRPGPRIDVGSGPSQFRPLLCDLDRLELELSREGLCGLLGRVPLGDAGFDEVELALRPDVIEIGGRVEGAGFTCRLAVIPGDDGALRVAVLDPRVHAPGAPPAATLAARLAASLSPGASEGAVATLAPVRPVLLRTVPQRGFKLPRISGARLSSARATAEGIRLGWSRSAAPPVALEDLELVATLDGARAFAAAEGLLGGDEGAARKAWLSLPPGARTHPFAAARLLSLLSAEPRCHAEARALAREWLARDPEFAPALAAEALVAAAAGESAEASRAFGALARVSRRRDQVLATLAAAEACAALGARGDPAALAAALDAALALRRSHLPALRALHDHGRRALDRAALLRACRGLAAHARDPLEKARAHARLAVLLADSDRAAARLHLANALRLGPADPEAVEAAARLGSR